MSVLQGTCLEVQLKLGDLQSPVSGAQNSMGVSGRYAPDVWLDLMAYP